MALSLPSFAPFPSPAWRELIALDEWNACLGAWISLAEAHLGLLDSEFTQKSLKDESLQQFLTDCMRQVASSGSSILGTSNPAKLLMKDCFLLTARILKLPSIPSIFTQWEFLADFSRVYGKKRVAAVLSSLPKSSQAAFEHTLGDLKKFLIRNLDAGLAGDLKAVEQRLDQLNSLIHASPSTASFFLAGSDFLDGLISCYKIMNPPLRKVIITTTYLSLVGLIEGESPKLSMLTDQLYSLKTAADTHKAGPLNVNDSLVAELVTTTPILQQIEHKLEVSGTATTRTKNVLKDLAAYRKPGVGMKPKRLIKRKVDKGKALALDDRSAMEREVHIHHMSQISQIQDLFPELGSGFVSKLLDEYDGDSEQVIAHLLEDSLPSHLQGADRGEELSSDPTHEHQPDLAPHPTPPQIPARKNVFDDDELDTLALGTSKLHIGKRDAKKTADDVLADRSTAPNKAAILSALAAFDSDDDERDDTYDAEDVGGTVDAANTEEPADSKDGNEEALFRAYQTDAKVFERDAATRRSVARTKLRHETGMTDEAIEGWAVMLTRNPNQKRKLELKYSAVGAFTGQQSELVSTAWRPSPAGSGAEESDVDGGRPAFRGGRGRGRGRGGRGGRGDAAGPPGEQGTEQARRRKEANKGSRANHNRRDQRAKKMARGGFPG